MIWPFNSCWLIQFGIGPSSGSLEKRDRKSQVCVADITRVTFLFYFSPSEIKRARQKLRGGLKVKEETPAVRARELDEGDDREWKQRHGGMICQL